MKRLINIEIKRILSNKLFWITLFIGCVISVSQYFLNVLPCVKYLDVYKNEAFGGMCPHTWYEKWIGGEWYTSQSYILFLIIPILAATPCGISLAKDKKTGFQYQLFIREKKNRYYASKYIVSFISGGIAVLLPLFLNLWLSILTLPSIIPDPATGTSMITDNMMLSSLYFTHPNLYILIYFLLIFAFSGLFSVFSLVIGEMTKSQFMSTIFPFMTYAFIHFVFDIMHIPQYSPFCYLSPTPRITGITPQIIIFEFLILLLSTGCALFFYSRKNETID